MSIQRTGMAVALLLGALSCSPSPSLTPPVPLVLPPPPPVLGDSTFVDVVGRSSAAFFGTVMARAARTTDAVETSSLTTVVRVDSLIRWGTAVDVAPGESVTVIVRDTMRLSVNGRYGFLANGVVLDTGVVLQETWRERASGAALRSTFTSAYASAIPRALDRKTHDHLQQIGIVIWGPVTSISMPQVPDSILRRIRSETAPGWRIATIVPRRVFLGDTTLMNQPVRVLFPGNRHIVYARVPRPVSGDSGVYLLHRPAQFPRLFAGINTAGAFVLFDPLDLRPLGDTTRVKNLIAQRP